MQALNFIPLMEILISTVVAIELSNLIDFLYSLPNSSIRFLKKKARHTNLRKTFLLLMTFLALIYCENLTFLVMLYKMTAVTFLLVITVTDFEHYIIFDIVLIGFSLTGIVFAIILEVPLFERLIAAMCGGTAFFALLVLTRNGIGGGDVKLVASLGLWLGLEGLLSTVLLASILGGICALCLIITGIKSRTDFFAYGPYFCIVAACHLFS